MIDRARVYAQIVYSFKIIDDDEIRIVTPTIDYILSNVMQAHQIQFEINKDSKVGQLKISNILSPNDCNHLTSFQIIRNGLSYKPALGF